MKKIIRVISVLLVALSFCLIFAGCDMIDELREKHAIISEDRKAVIYQGKTFLRLPEGIPYFFNDSTSNIINITDYDVPVLLSEDFCYTGYYDPLSDIIAVSWVDENEVTSYNSTGYTYFTQKENYEKYVNLKTDDADRIGFYNDYTDYNTILLSSESSKEILGLIKDTESWNTQVIKNISAGIYPLYKCNKELTLRGTLEHLELYITEENNVYLSNIHTGENVKLSENTARDIIDKFYVN